MVAWNKFINFGAGGRMIRARVNRQIVIAEPIEMNRMNDKSAVFDGDGPAGWRRLVGYRRGRRWRWGGMR